MIVGVVGLGKLGLPTAAILALQGFSVRGYDRRPDRMTVDALPPWELDEGRAGPLRARVDGAVDLRFCALEEVVRGSACVLVVVETPHGADYEGITPLPETRADFCHTALCAALGAVVAAAEHPVEIGVISTVLPGTVRSRLLPITGRHPLVYCPQFVAMGTVAHDLRHPEFTLLGRGDRPSETVRRVWEGVRAAQAPTFELSYEIAELAKVTYNTVIGAKVTVANVVQQLAHVVGASAADVLAVLRSADRRLASASYLGPGMGDGGPCHPRDNIAMSWLAREVGLTADLFSALMLQRQAYVEWLADTFVTAARGRPLVLLGTAYKPGTPLRTGSSSVLLANLLQARGHAVTVLEDGSATGVNPGDRPAAFFLGCPDQGFLAMRFPAGSVVVDPWHRIRLTDDVEVLHVGERG